MKKSELERLADVEASLEAEVLAVQGRMNEKTEKLRETGVFSRYSDVFSAYLLLAAPPESSIEALKRATFLAWYEVAEPSCFSGVDDLPDDARPRVMGLLESVVSHFDAEFRWMLACYYQIAGYAFPELERYPTLQRFLKTEDPNRWLDHRLRTQSMEHRGQMGKYWTSMFQA